MQQPEGLQQELLKMSRESRAWVLDLVNQLADAGDGDTWREACQRVEAELEQTREQLQALSDGVNRRCGEDVSQLPLVSVDKIVKQFEEARALWTAAIEAEGTDWANEIVEAAEAGGGE
jgi:hypothetical protein